MECAEILFMCGEPQGYDERCKKIKGILMMQDNLFSNTKGKRRKTSWKLTLR
jgi:hypothetical protein